MEAEEIKAIEPSRKIEQAMSDQRQRREDSGSYLLLPLYMYNLQVIELWGEELFTH